MTTRDGAAPLRSLRSVSSPNLVALPQGRSDEELAQHLRDRPAFCPACGAAIAGGLVVEYWEASRRVFHCWCPACRRSHEILMADRVIGSEPEH